MSFQREVKRRNMRENLKMNGMRSRCRKCGTRMIVKPGYGYVCEECGWISATQIAIRNELQEESKKR